MTTGEVRFEAGKSVLLPARGGQLIGPIVNHAHETRFVVAQAARTRDRGLTITENPGNAGSLGPMSSSYKLHEILHWASPMEAAYISALAALAGTAIGGLTSFATSWTTQQAQARAQRLAAERDARAALFGRFLEEAAKLYSDALQSRQDDMTRLIGIYALTNQIRLISSPQVVEAADTVCRIIIDTYLAPNITMEEMRANWTDRHVDPLRDFSEACRQELQTFGRYWTDAATPPTSFVLMRRKGRSIAAEREIGAQWYPKGPMASALPLHLRNRWSIGVAALDYVDIGFLGSQRGLDRFNQPNW
jgi:hypothetical protein